LESGGELSVGEYLMAVRYVRGRGEAGVRVWGCGGGGRGVGEGKGVRSGEGVFAVCRMDSDALPDVVESGLDASKFEGWLRQRRDVRVVEFPAAPDWARPTPAWRGRVEANFRVLQRAVEEVREAARAAPEPTWLRQQALGASAQPQWRQYWSERGGGVAGRVRGREELEGGEGEPEGKRLRGEEEGLVRSQGRGDVGGPQAPSTAALVRLSHVEACDMLRRVVAEMRLDAMRMDACLEAMVDGREEPLTRAQCAWLWSLLACVELPLPIDEAPVVRSVAYAAALSRAAFALRGSSSDAASISCVAACNALLVAAGRVFGQALEREI
jgi:Survival motor neuron (SMN) interacting protein 1 (SIP1)